MTDTLENILQGHGLTDINRATYNLSQRIIFEPNLKNSNTNE